MESKKINQLATELTPALSDLTIIGDPTTGISKKITLSQMASLFTGTVEEYPSLASFPLVGVADTIYIATDTNILYRWDTSLNAYAELSPNIVTSLVFSDANGFDGTISLVGSVATLTITTALTQGSVAFIGASGALSQDNDNFFWDDTNNRLGIGTKLPTTALDVFGSGIIGRVNGTSTNNAFLGFASAGTNKWSIGNVQSDHRFRIYSEANTSELVSVLQTGEFGIGIANPTTKLHIDGGASALIANLDADISIAKSISFRSDNSARINIEVSGTESGSNAGANFFLRTYTDAGALLATPITITRSTGAISLATSLIGANATFNDIIAITLSNADSRIIGGTTTGRLLLGNSGTSTYAIIYGATHATFPNSIQFVNNNTASLTLASNGMLSFEGTGNTIPLRFQDITATITGQTAGYIGMSTSAFNGNNGDLVLYPRTSAPSKILLIAPNVDIGNNTTNATLNLSGDNGGGDSFLNFKADIGAIKAQIQGAKFAGTGGILTFKTLQSSTLTTVMVLDQNGRIIKGTDNTTTGQFQLGGQTGSPPNAILVVAADQNAPYPIGVKGLFLSQGLVGFFDSSNAVQGSISIASTIVSYNSFMGSHYSQFKDNDKPEVLKGTILETIDELCEWEGETNDRLAKVKISDTIESKNVYGIFLDWDNSDEFNDMLVAALGASYIRVNKDEIVSMGDLLQSNGDGTAKVQSDDIMRSSTIAKVVSTNKIETYADGSYLIAVTLHCG